MKKTFKVLMVCHGNICRSPMAEFIMKKIISGDDRLKNMNIIVSSAAVSSEETGNDIYPPAKAKLREKNVPFERRKARRIVMRDYEEYDLLIGMDESNIRRMRSFFNEPPYTGTLKEQIAKGKKIFCLPEFWGSSKAVADPWYTDDFETAYRDIEKGCLCLTAFLKQENEQN